MSDPAQRAAKRIFTTDEARRWVADIIRAEYGELLPCGHLRACWQEEVVVTQQGVDKERHVIGAKCTACEREAAAVQARDRQWCSELAKQDVAARAVYPGGIEIEVPTIAEAVEAAREECARCSDEFILRHPKWNSYYQDAWMEIARAIRALNLTGALDRVIARAYLAAREAVRGVAATDNGQRCLDRAELAIRALTPASAQAALDRKVNEARLDGVTRAMAALKGWMVRLPDGTIPAAAEGVLYPLRDELKAALEKP